jgi:hypothetical protein
LFESFYIFNMLHYILAALECFLCCAISFFFLRVVKARLKASSKLIYDDFDASIVKCYTRCPTHLNHRERN